MSLLAWQMRADEIGAGKTVTFHAPENALVALAEGIGVDRVLAFTAQLRVVPFGDEAFDVAGKITAKILQTCVVSLEPFEVEISEPVEVRFSTAGDAAAPVRADDPDIDDEGSPGMAETSEPIVGGRLDLGAVAQELLALAVDPYPRKPGASFEPAIEEATPSPFAALAKRRGRTDAGN